MALAILDHSDPDASELESTLRGIIPGYAIGWTKLCDTLRFLAESLSDEYVQELRITRTQLYDVLDSLGDPRSWPFLTDIEHETANSDHLHGLDLYEQWCEDLAAIANPWTRKTFCPRVRFRERIVLHAYSGRRRHGDFQWFFDHIAQEKSLTGFMVLSMDIVIDADLGDISQSDTQRFWLQAIRAGYVVAMLSGPPCCTWSVARGKTDRTL